jgi:hypothetical protein
MDVTVLHSSVVRMRICEQCVTAIGEIVSSHRSPRDDLLNTRRPRNHEGSRELQERK